MRDYLTFRDPRPHMVAPVTALADRIVELLEPVLVDADRETAACALLTVAYKLRQEQS